jgi:hypothetical protein
MIELKQSGQGTASGRAGRLRAYIQRARTMRPRMIEVHRFRQAVRRRPQAVLDNTAAPGIGRGIAHRAEHRQSGGWQ